MRAIIRRFKAFALKREVITGVFLSFLLALAGQYAEYRGFFSGFEGIVTDGYLRARSPAGSGDSGDKPPAVVALALDDPAYEQFFRGSSPLAPYTVFGLLHAVVAAFKPAVLAVDLLTESTEYDWLTKAWPLPVPVVWAADANNRFIDEPRFFTFDLTNGPGGWLSGENEVYYLSPGAVLGSPSDKSQAHWGVPLFPRELDRAIRRFPRQWRHEGTAGESDQTFARMVARAYCNPPQKPARPCRSLGDVDAAFLSYKDQARTMHLVSELFTCQPITGALPEHCLWTRTKKELELPLQDPIVVVGGTFAQARDSYASTLDENTPGLMLNAQAVRIELSGRAVREAARHWSFGVDLAIGFSLVVLFWFTHGRKETRLKTMWPFAWIRQGHLLRRKIQAGLAIMVLLIFLSRAFFFDTGFLWLSWVGMLLGTFAWEIVLETWMENPPDELRVEELKARIPSARLGAE